jgi:hypothetical protein
MDGNLFNGECPVERVDERSDLVDRRILLELYIGVVNVCNNTVQGIIPATGLR